MSAIYQKSLASWYSDGVSWASHSSMELTSNYARAGRIQFNTLSGGAAITSLSFKFYKTNSGGGGTFEMYATTDPNLLPGDLASMTYLGTSPVFGSGTGWKTLALSQQIMDRLNSFSGTWYLVITCSVYVTFTGGSGTNAPYFEGEYADGSMYVSDGGIMKLGAPNVSDGGIMKYGLAYISDGGIMKLGIP